MAKPFTKLDVSVLLKGGPRSVFVDAKRLRATVSRLITVEAQNADLIAAVRSLLAAHGEQYDAAVPGRHVTCGCVSCVFARQLLVDREAT